MLKLRNEDKMKDKMYRELDLGLTRQEIFRMPAIQLLIILDNKQKMIEKKFCRKEDCADE